MGEASKLENANSVVIPGCRLAEVASLRTKAVRPVARLRSIREQSDQQSRAKR
jgi:hypothetical protein